MDETALAVAPAIVPEVLPPQTPAPWQFQKGNRLGGRKHGALDKVTREVKSQIAEAIASGQKIHPLEVLLNICNDPKASGNLRRAAASDLLPYLLPQKHAVELSSPEPADEARIQLVKRTLAGLWLEETITVAPGVSS